MQGLWDILSGAPWWVYLLLIILARLGIQAMHARTVSIQRVLLLPLVFVVWSLYNLYTEMALGHSSLPVVWIIALVVGAYLGAKEVQRWKISHNRQKGTITIPGNRSTLILILLIFVLKFFWGYWYATHTPVSPQIYFWDTLTSAVVTGFFVGRAYIFYRRYRTHVNPKLKCHQLRQN